NDRARRASPQLCGPDRDWWGLLKGFEEKRGYLSLKLDALSFNLVSLCELAGPDGNDASLLVLGGGKNWSRCILHHPGRVRWAGPREEGQTRPCRAADAKRTYASEGLAPNQRGDLDLRQGKHHMIAGDCRGDRE